LILYKVNDIAFWGFIVSAIFWQITDKYLTLTIILSILDHNPEREALSMYRDRVEKVMEDYFDAVSLTPVILQLDVVKPKNIRCYLLLFSSIVLLCIGIVFAPLV